MKILIDGAQGTGKSKLGRLFKDKGFWWKNHSEVFPMRANELYADLFYDGDILHTRGIIGEAVYSTLLNKNKPATKRSQFKELLENVDYIFVLYSSNIKFVLKEVAKRERSLGRELTESDVEIIAEANGLFQGYGKLLRVMNPHKVILVDVFEEKDKNLFEEITRTISIREIFKENEL